MKLHYKTTILFSLLVLNGCMSTEPIDSNTAKFEPLITSAISFKIEGDELVEIIEAMAFAGAGAANREETVRQLGGNLSTLLFVCSQEELSNLGIEFYSSDEPPELIDGDDGNEYIAVRPWELYVPNRMYAGKSLVDFTHIKDISLQRNGLLRVKFYVSQFAKGIFFINPETHKENSNGEHIFLRQANKYEIEYISFNEIIREKPNMHNNSRQ